MVLLKRVALLFGLSLLALRSESIADDTIASDKRALAALQAYVGDWRGVAQPKRGSSQGAWTEKSQWAWQFAEGHAELVGELSEGRYFAKLQLRPGTADGQFTLLATPLPDMRAGTSSEASEPITFAGSLTDDALVLSAEKPQQDGVGRISVRLVAGGDRMLVLYEKRVGDGVYARLAEVGSTRQGSSFAKAANAGPECVVTGGLGTIAVEHNAQKYFVCCTGCRDLFLLDPDGVLEEYRQRKEAERDGKK